eukprot:2861336-Prymnesium_polylepis.1
MAARDKVCATPDPRLPTASAAPVLTRARRGWWAAAVPVCMRHPATRCAVRSGPARLRLDIRGRVQPSCTLSSTRHARCDPSPPLHPARSALCAPDPRERASLSVQPMPEPTPLQPRNDSSSATVQGFTRNNPCPSRL